MTEPKHLWLKQEDETFKNYQYFIAFRDLGHGRTLKKVAELRNVTLSYTSKLSCKHDWVKRAEAWDLYLNQVRLDSSVSAQEAAADEGTIKSNVALKKAETVVMEALDQTIEKLRSRAAENNPSLPLVVKPSDIRSLLDTVIKVQRLEEGKATEITSNQKPDALKNMSTEDLMEIQRLKEKLRAANED